MKTITIDLYTVKEILGEATRFAKGYEHDSPIGSVSACIDKGDCRNCAVLELSEDNGVYDNIELNYALKDMKKVHDGLKDLGIDVYSDSVYVFSDDFEEAWNEGRRFYNEDNPAASQEMAFESDYNERTCTNLYMLFEKDRTVRTSLPEKEEQWTHSE